MAKLTLSHLSAWSLGVLLLFSLGLEAQTVTTVEGLDASTIGKPQLDIDPNGSIGTKQYMEWVNTYYQAWNKTTLAKIYSQSQMGASIFMTNGLGQCSSLMGDGIVTFDRLASRWIIAAHNTLTANITSYAYCVAVSSTDDLTSTSLKWYTYAFPLSPTLGTNSSGTQYFPDWPKFGTWDDAYYVGMDVQDPNAGFQEVGVIACAFDRADMLIGATALPPQCFKYPTTANGVYTGHSLEPADVDGTTGPAAGSPEYFVSIQNPVIDGSTNTSSTFNLWQFQVDWSNPANTTFTQTSVPAPTFTPGCYNLKFPSNTLCIPEPSTATSGQPIDSVGDRFMYRFAYRNFGSYQSYLISHTVQVGTTALSQTGIRWYELRGDSVPTIYQSGTVSPDQSLYRFMPSIAQDQSANAAVGYSTSSSAVSPSIAASYFSLASGSSPTEISLYTGAGDEENSYHWGDYSSMTVDPVDGCTFWYVNEYFSANQIGTGKPIWKTRISNFAVPGCGTGTVSVSPTSLNFGSEAEGTTSTPLPVVLTNSQNTALTINSIFGGGTNPGDFRQSNNCGSSVAANSSCTINISFAPSATGTRSATLNVSDNAANSPQVVTLTGTGTNGPTVSLSTTSINFGNQAWGTTSGASAVIVTNTGNATVTFASIQVTGTNSANFAESDNCLPTLVQGSTCTINVTFSPTAATTYSATLTLNDNAANNPQTVPLAGTGVTPVTLSASSVGFGTILVGSSKTAPAVTLTNQMSTALTFSSFSFNSAEYTQINTCGTSIAAGATCSITITFAPTASGAQNGTLTIADNSPNSPQTLALTGNGQLPVVVNPVSLAFGTVKVGTTSAAKSTTVTNNLKAPLTITSIALTGTDPGDYAISSKTCGSILASGANCTVSVTFKPTAKGNRGAMLAITDNATTSPQNVALAGTGN